jgi:steroid delta-isomerase-like uncharacterized protein
LAVNVEDLSKVYIEAVNSHNVEKMISFFTDDCIYEDMAVGVANHGKRETEAFVTGWFIFSEDMHFEVTSFFSAGDWAATEWIMTGTYTGDLPGIPANNKRFSVRGSSVIEIRGDKISRNTDYWNFAMFLKQVDALPEDLDVSSKIEPLLELIREAQHPEE